MVGCLQALGLCRRKPKVNEAPAEEKTPHTPTTEDSSEATIPDPEKPPLKEEAVDEQSPKGASARANANQTPGSGSVDHGAKSKEDQVDDPEEEAARRKRDEEEEQERLDFFQMM